MKRSASNAVSTWRMPSRRQRASRASSISGGMGTIWKRIIVRLLLLHPEPVPADHDRNRRQLGVVPEDRAHHGAPRPAIGGTEERDRPAVAAGAVHFPAGRAVCRGDV